MTYTNVCQLMLYSIIYIRGQLRIYARPQCVKSKSLDSRFASVIRAQIREYKRVNSKRFHIDWTFSIVHLSFFVDKCAMLLLLYCTMGAMRRNMLLCIFIRYLWTILDRCWAIGAYLWSIRPLGKLFFAISLWIFLTKGADHLSRYSRLPGYINNNR